MKEPEVRARIAELEDFLNGTAEQDRSEHVNWYVGERLTVLRDLLGKPEDKADPTLQDWSAL